MKDNIIELVDSLPPFRLLANIIRAFARSDFAYSDRELYDAIKREPSIAAKVIAVANSAYYHPPSPIYDVGCAIQQMGLSQTKTLIYKIILSERFPTHKCTEFSMNRFWYDTMMVSHYSKQLYKHIDRKPIINADEIGTIGLLHSIGMLLMVYQCPDEMSQIFKEGEAGRIIKSEQEIFDTNHYIVGARLLTHWELPILFGDVLTTMSDTQTSCYVNRDTQYISDILHLIKVKVAAKNSDSEPLTTEQWGSIGVTPGNISMAIDVYKKTHDEIVDLLQLLA